MYRLFADSWCNAEAVSRLQPESCAVFQWKKNDLVRLPIWKDHVFQCKNAQPIKTTRLILLPIVCILLEFVFKNDCWYIFARIHTAKPMLKALRSPVLKKHILLTKVLPLIVTRTCHHGQSVRDHIFMASDCIF